MGPIFQKSHITKNTVGVPNKVFKNLRYVLNDTA